METKDSGHPIFDDRQALSREWTPTSFEYREDEIEALKTYLSPSLWETGPATVLLSGLPESGKRTAVSMLCSDIENTHPEVNPTLVTIDCEADTTAYELAITVANSLIGEEVLASSGYTRETAFRRMRHWIREFDGTPILRLDTVNVVDSTEIEVFLSGLLDTDGSIVAGLVAIADDPTFRNELSPAIRDRFHGEVYFGPYDRDTQRDILQRRAATAFRTDACPAVTIDRCLSVARGAEEGLRTALTLLQGAGDIASEEGEATVRPAHVESAWKSIRRQRIEQTISTLSSHERLTLRALLEGEEEIRFTDIYERYSAICDDADVSPNRERSVHNYLQTLESTGLIETTERHSKDAGVLYEYQSRHTPELVLEVLD